MKLKSCLASIFFTVIFSVSASCVLVYADKGDLQINNQVIYEQKGGSPNNTATFTIYQLFLTEMTEREKQLAEKQEKIISTAKKAEFIKDTPKVESIVKKVTPQLFSKEYKMTEEGHSSSENKRNQSTIGFLLLCIFGGLFVISLGICLGKTFPRLLKRT